MEAGTQLDQLRTQQPCLARSLRWSKRESRGIYWGKTKRRHLCKNL